MFFNREQNFFQRLHTLDQFFVFQQSALNGANQNQLLASLDASQIPLSTVFLNPPTAAQMRKRSPAPALSGTSVLPIDPHTIVEADQQFAVSGIQGANRQIAPFPDNSIAVKTAWFLVSSSVWSANPIPVWHGLPAGASSTDALKPNQWPDRIRIDPHAARHTCKQVDLSCPNLEKPSPATPTPTVAKLSIVPIDRLFYVPVCTCEQAQSLKEKLGNLYGVYPGDYVVLMGLHLTTREIPDWVWATFWWSDRPVPEFSGNRPFMYPAPWNNYQMDATLDMVTPRNRKGQPKAIYNPWLEAVTMPLDKAVISNCMNCHRTSAYPRIPFPPPGFIDPAGDRLRDKTKLDFLWTIGSQFDAPQPEPRPASIPKSVRQ